MQYIQIRKTGADHDKALLSSGQNQETFLEALKNPNFSTALKLVESGAGTTILTAPELLRLLRAQVPEDLIAGFFAMTTEELIERVKESPELTKIWNTGPKRGKAEIMMVQHTLALAGDTDMVKFWGKEHLGQDRNNAKTVDIETIAAMAAALRAKLGEDPERLKLVESKFKEGKIIDVDPVESEEGEEECSETERK